MPGYVARHELEVGDHYVVLQGKRRRPMKLTGWASTSKAVFEGARGSDVVVSRTKIVAGWCPHMEKEIQLDLAAESSEEQLGLASLMPEKDQPPPDPPTPAEIRRERVEKLRARPLWRAVLQALVAISAPASDATIAKSLSVSGNHPDSVRRARRELTDVGYIKDSGEKEPASADAPDFNSTRTKWVPTQDGYRSWHAIGYPDGVHAKAGYPK